MGFPIRRFDSNDQPLPVGTPAPPTASPLAPSPLAPSPLAPSPLAPGAPPTPRITLTDSTPGLSSATQGLWSAPTLPSATDGLWSAPPLPMARLTLPPISQHLTEPASLPLGPSAVSANRRGRRIRTANNAGSHEGPALPAVTPSHVSRAPALMRQVQATAEVLQAMVGEESTEPEVERSVESDSNAE